MVWLHGETAIETVQGVVRNVIAVHKGKGGFVAVVGTEAVKAETWEEAVNKMCELLKAQGQENSHPRLI